MSIVIFEFPVLSSISEVTGILKIGQLYCPAGIFLFKFD